MNITNLDNDKNNNREELFLTKNSLKPGLVILNMRKMCPLISITKPNFLGKRLLGRESVLGHFWSTSLVSPRAVMLSSFSDS